MLKIKSDKIVTPQGLFDGFVYIEGGKIEEVSAKLAPCGEEYDFTGLYVSPGFIDLHTHGGGGHAFMDSSAEEVLAGCDFHLAHGTTTILPTISAAPFSAMRAAVRDIDAAMRSGRAKGHIFGIFLQSSAARSAPILSRRRKKRNTRRCLRSFRAASRGGRMRPKTIPKGSSAALLRGAARSFPRGIPTRRIRQ